MQFACTCGWTIRDQTDYLPHKAELVARQDLEDFLDDPQSTFVALTRTVYQCDQCGRLWVEDQSGKLKSFAPETAADRILASKRGPAWKAPLIGTWQTRPAPPYKPGLLHCDSALKDCGLSQQFVQWEDLKRAYFDEFEKRRTLGTLRHAVLKKDGEVIHHWAFETVDRQKQS